jgi:hypothetical protein
MSCRDEQIQSGMVETRPCAAGGGRDAEPSVPRLGLPEWPRMQVVAVPPAAWRLVGCESKPPRETPRLGHWGRSIARSENRRMEHLARMLGLRSLGAGSDLPPAA